MKTEIQVLDRLLGLTEKSRSQISIPKTQAMLIRGAPGSGKTTLALEILARTIIKKTPSFGIFLSLEVNPPDAWKAVFERLSREVTAKLPGPEFEKHGVQQVATVLKSGKGEIVAKMERLPIFLPRFSLSRVDEGDH